MDNSWVAPGVRCVCIGDGWNEGLCGLPVRVPMLGEVLTIRSAAPGNGCEFGGSPQHVYLTFWEIEPRQTSSEGVEATIRWISTQFEPLVEQETDISIFEAMLDTAREPANV